VKTRSIPATAVIVVLGATLLAPIGLRAAEDLEAVLFANRDQVRIDEEFELTIEVRGADAGNANAPDLFGLEDVRILGFPSEYSRYQWLNGRTSFTKSFRYTLMADHEGQIEIPPVNIQVGDREVTTTGLTILVTAATAGDPSRRSGPPSADMQEEMVRARAEVDKEEVYLGEQVTIRFKVLTPREIRGLELLEQPVFPGFWVEEIPQDVDRDIRRIRRDGSSFIEYTVIKRALFPSRTGDLHIDPVIFSVTIPRRRSDPFGSMFFESRQTLHRRTERLTIKVNSLPEAGRPDDFRGAVGDFRLSVITEPRDTRVNDAVTLKVTVQGEGNMSTLEPPLVVIPEEFRRYDPRISENLVAGENGVGGSKTWDFVLVPRIAGSHTLPPVHLSFFDPQQGGYRSVRSGPVVVNVEPADMSGGSGPAIRGHRDLVAQGNDIHFIKSHGGRLRDRSHPLYRHPVTLLALILPAAGNGTLFLVQRWRRHSRLNRTLFRRRRAWARARRRFEQAERDGPGDRSRHFESLSRILSDYLSDKFDVPAAGLTTDRITSLLVTAGVPDHLARELCACIEACDAARFDRSRTPPDPATLLEKTRRTLARIEKRQ
jgi:hypothetical protein